MKKTITLSALCAVSALGIAGAALSTATVNNPVNLSIDKKSISYDEMFKVTVSGLPSLYFTNGDILKFSDANSKSSSCLSGNNRGSETCRPRNEVSCGILPKYMGAGPSQWQASKDGVLEFICHLSDDEGVRGFAVTNKETRTYSAKVVAPSPIPYSNGSLTSPMISNNIENITAKVGGASTMETNYNACQLGSGLNPNRVYAGCVECKNVPEEWREGMSTCKNIKQETYSWTSHKRSSVIDVYPQCDESKSGSCSKESLPCEVSKNPADENGVVYTCEPASRDEATNTTLEEKLSQKIEVPPQVSAALNSLEVKRSMMPVINNTIDERGGRQAFFGRIDNPNELKFDIPEYLKKIFEFFK